MNATTRETLENLIIVELRVVDSLERQLKRMRDEMERVRDQVKAESRKVDEYLSIIAKADPSFDREAWLTHAKLEWII